MKTVRMDCASCGAPVIIPEGADSIICPSCKTTLGIDRGEGYITLKIIEKLAESIHEMGEMTSSALKENAFVTQVELRRMQINQLISMDEMKLNSLAAEIRATKRRLKPGPILNEELGELLLQENDIRLHIRSLRQEIARLEPGWEDSLAYYRQDIVGLDEIIKGLSPYAYIVPVMNRLERMKAEREKCQSVYDRVEVKLLRKDIQSDKYPDFAKLTLEEMEALREKIPADLIALREKPQSGVNQDLQDELQAKLEKINQVYPRRKVESLTGKLPALDLNGPYPEAPEKLKPLIDQVESDLAKLGEVSDFPEKKAFVDGLKQKLQFLTDRAAMNIPAINARKKKNRLIISLAGLSVVGLCIILGVVIGGSLIAGNNGNAATDGPGDGLGGLVPKETDPDSVSSVTEEGAVGTETFQAYTARFVEVSSSSAYLRESPDYNAEGSTKVVQGDILNVLDEGGVPEGWFKVATTDGTKSGYLAIDWVKPIMIMSVPGEPVATGFTTEHYSFDFSTMDASWNAETFDDDFARGETLYDLDAYTIDITSKDEFIYFYVNQTISDLPEQFIYSLTIEGADLSDSVYYGLMTNYIDGGHFDAALITPMGNLMLLAVRDGYFTVLYDSGSAPNPTVEVNRLGNNEFTMSRYVDQNNNVMIYEYGINGKAFVGEIVENVVVMDSDLGAIVYLDELGDHATIRIDDFLVRK